MKQLKYNIYIYMLHGDLNKITINNNYFRKVINTTKNQQLVLMSLKPKEEIGMEIHNHVDQFIRIEKGSCTLIMDNKYIKLKKEYFVVIPAGTQHNIINTGRGDLKLYSIYSPPEHKKNKIDKHKPI